MKTVVMFFAVVLLLGANAAAQKKSGNRCWDTATSQHAMNECVASDVKAAKLEMDRLLQRLQQKYRDDRLALQKLQDAQVAWEKFVEAELKAIYPSEQPGEYGTVNPMCVSNARAELIQQRIKMLKRILNPVEGDVCGH